MDTLIVCETARQLLGIVAWSWLVLTNVVLTVHALPKLRRAPELNPDPKIFSSNGPEFSAALEGEMELNDTPDDEPEPALTDMVPETPLVGSET